MDPKPPPETPKSRIKLFSKSKILLMLCAVAAGAFYRPFQEYYASGSVSGMTLGISITTLIFSSAIVLGVVWYANKPEQ